MSAFLTLNRTAQPAASPRRASPSSRRSIAANSAKQSGACACGGGCPRCARQAPTLRVSTPSDAAEREADEIARQVMGPMPSRPVVPVNQTPAGVIHRQEAPPDDSVALVEPPKFLKHDFDVRLDWFEMTRPFYTRGADVYLFQDPRLYWSVGTVWTGNYDLFAGLGLGDSLAKDAANFFTPFAIDSALKRDFPTSSEIFERNANITSFMVTPTLFNFDLHDIPGTLRLPFLSVFGVNQPNPYAPPTTR